MGSATPFATLLSTFGAAVAAKFRTGAGQPEDHLRAPLERFITSLGGSGTHRSIVLAGEERLGDVRPDYAVEVGGALVGVIEVKAPGKGADPHRFRDRHDRDQWEQLRRFHNLLYTDGNSWGVYRFGERVGEVETLLGDVQTAGATLGARDRGLDLLLTDFLSWTPTPPRSPRELALNAARLCGLLRTEIAKLLATDLALQALAEDWRELLFPDATDDEFADGYAQTVTFALLLARVEDIDFEEGDLGRIADRLGDRHTLIATALDVLTDRRLLGKLAVSLGVLVRVLGVVDWGRLSRGDTDKWLLFYEDFLQEYDPKLRRSTGSYYTPNPVVDAMVRLVDGLLRQRLGRHYGLAAPDVTVVDPATGTGTFLFRVVDRIAATIAEEEGEAEVPAKLRQAARRLIGFELQTGPFAVAEFRLAEEYRRRGARPGPEGLRLYVANTLDDPFAEDVRLAAVYEPIARSRRRANQVKKTEPVLVVIGNPPYRERSHGSGGWIERGNPEVGRPPPLEDFLPAPEWGLGAHVKHLYNPYVYFWRWATWKVFDRHPDHPLGVVALVTVAGFLNGPGFAGMRAYLRRTADEIWVVDLSPEGHQPPVNTRVFTGVQQPVCITIAVRDGSTGADSPAPVHHLAVTGLQEDKFDALTRLGFDDDRWRNCPTALAAPFLPASAAGWAAMPALGDLLPWSGSGTMPGRTWVCGPSPDVLQIRWERLVGATAAEKPELLTEHRTDRTVRTVLRDNLPGYRATARPLAEETGACPPAERIGYRSFDRQWILADKRLINRPNPALWAVRSKDQVYLTALMAHSPSNGPAVTLSALVPDLHHYRGSFGGRAFPLWRDPDGSQANVAPGLLGHLSRRCGVPVTAPDLFAYLAALLAHPGFTARFAGDLVQPGLRVPLTADADLFAEATDLGRRVVWLHTYGERFADPTAGRPARPPKLPADRRPKVRKAIPDTPAGMPTEISHDARTQELHVGAGVIAPVPRAVWEYEVSGMRVVRKWFGYRKRDPEGRRSSPLDDVNAAWWEPGFTSELLELLNVLGLLVDLEPAQLDLLDRVLAGPLVTAGELRAAGVLPVADEVRRSPRVAAATTDAPTLLDEP